MSKLIGGPLMLYSVIGEPVLHEWAPLKSGIGCPVFRVSLAVYTLGKRNCV